MHVERRIALTASLLATLIASALLSSSPAAGSESGERVSIKPLGVSKKGTAVVFPLRSLDPDRLSLAKLSLRHKSRRLNVNAVKRKASTNDRLRSRVPRRWLRAKKSPRKKALKTIALEVSLAEEAEESAQNPDDFTEGPSADPEPDTQPIETPQSKPQSEDEPPADLALEGDDPPVGDPVPPTDEQEEPEPEPQAPAQTGSDPNSGQSPPIVDPIPPSELKIGLISNAQGWHMNSAHVLDQTAPTGVQWIREEFEWEVIEPRDDEWHWERYDNLFIEAAERGIHVLPMLLSVPDWAGSSWNEIPANPSEFAEMTAQLAARYGPGGSFWEANPSIAEFAPPHFEIWNEPYLDYFSAGGVDAGRYARLVKAASLAAKSANPEAGIMLAADYSPSGKPSHTFIEDMYDAVSDLNDHFDAVAIHPYSGDSSPTDPRGGWGFPRVKTMREKMVAFGAADKPFWITETGWSTCPEPTGSYCVSESQQANYTAQLFELLQTEYSSYVQAVFLYRREDMNDNPSDKEGWFGMERLDGSKKPVYDVVRGAVGAL